MQLCGLLVLCLFASCSFDEDQPVAAPNTCTLPTDCASDLSCQAGVCVMSAVDTPLAVTLEVTPKRMPDGSQPFPILYGPFGLQNARRDSFALGVPTTIDGIIHSGIELIPAQITFVPTKAPPSLAKPIQARSSISKLRSMFSVQLLAGVEYRVMVQPTDAQQPPYTTTYTADPAMPLDIDYADLPKTTQSFLIRGAPTNHGLKMRAKSKDGSQILSNTADVGDGRPMLTFAQEKLPEFKLEISADQSNAPIITVTNGNDDCDGTTPLLPTFTIDDTAFKKEASTNVKSTNGYDLAVDLPTLPEPIEYDGTIQLCEAKKGVDKLLVSLRSSALARASFPQGITASYNVSTTASKTTDTKTQNFCARVVPGEYVVLVTPPSAVNCEIFAERRQIVAAQTEPDTLELRTPTKLNGKILDSQMAPIANATIDAIALGIDTNTMVAENDLTVPIYNRSRQTSSQLNGAFEFYVDVGVYDLIVKPPAQSGFAWQVQPGLSIGGSRNADFTTRVELGAPALIEGNLRYADGSGKGTLAGAEVHAYTVEDEKGPNARGVEIGHTTADENGNVTLFVSPEPQPPW